MCSIAHRTAFVVSVRPCPPPLIFGAMTNELRVQLMVPGAAPRGRTADSATITDPTATSGESPSIRMSLSARDRPEVSAALRSAPAPMPRNPGPSLRSGHSSWLNVAASTLHRFGASSARTSVNVPISDEGFARESYNQTTLLEAQRARGAVAHMGEDDVIDESPLARAANQLRIPLRERRKGAAAATEVAKSVADDDTARREETREILAAVESGAREVMAAAVRAQRAEECGEEPTTPIAEENGHVERLCAAVQAALDHRACVTTGWNFGEVLRLDRLKIGGPSAGEGPKATVRTAAAALELLERELEPEQTSGSRFNVFRPSASASTSDPESSSSSSSEARVRGWIHRALNSGTLADKLSSLVQRHDITRAGHRNIRCYDPGALVADEECAARLIGACVGLAAVKFDLPTDAETLDALFAIPADGANTSAEGERGSLAAGALLNKTWGAVTGGVTTLGTAAVTGVGALGSTTAAGVNALGGQVVAIGTGAHALGNTAVTGVATGVKSMGEGIHTGVAATASSLGAFGNSIVDTLTWSRDVDAATNDLDLLSDMQDVLGEEGVVLLDERIDLSRHK